MIYFTGVRKMICIEKRITIVSCKLGDKTYVEVRQLYLPKYAYQSPYNGAISGYLWTWNAFNSQECSWRYRQMFMVVQDVFHPSHFRFIAICSQVALFGVCFYIFDSSVSGSYLYFFITQFPENDGISFF